MSAVPRKSDAPRKPGRPSAADQAVTRQEVVEAAARSIGQRGYRGTTLRGLAEELGVSLATVQHHVAGKDALWRAVVDEVVMARVERAAAAAAERLVAGDPEGAMRAMLASRLEDALTTPGLLNLVLGDGTAQDDERLHHLAEVMEEPRRRAMDMFREGHGPDVLEQMDLRAFSALVNIGLTAVVSSPDVLRVLFDVDVDDPDERHRFIQALIDIVVGGALPDPPAAESAG